MKDRILIRNARQHNLKGIDLDLPRRALLVLTGPSGSGKSSLAFDTVYAEGQRRYVESLSTYAKQFLERMEKPAVDVVEGISPAVAIEQKNPTKSSRSTVGTATEVHDYLRLLWARVGRTHCPECGRHVRPDSVQSATDTVLGLPAGTRFMVTFPLPLSARASHRSVVENLLALGFVRVLAGSETLDLDGPNATDPARLGHDLGQNEELLVIVDRLKVGADTAERLADSLTTAFAEGEGEAVVVVVGRRDARGRDRARTGGGEGERGRGGDGEGERGRGGERARGRGGERETRRGGEGETGRVGDGGHGEEGEPADAGERDHDREPAGAANVGGRRSAVGDREAGRRPAEHLRFSERFRCPDHDVAFADPTPRLFSFNNPYGSCPECTGFGAVLEYDESLIVPNPDRSLRQGAVEPWEMPRYRKYRERLIHFAGDAGVNAGAPWRELPDAFRRAVLQGNRKDGALPRFQGVLPFLRSRERKKYKQYIRVFLRRYQLARTCPACGGARLRPQALYIRVDGRHIGEVNVMTIADARAWVDGLHQNALSEHERDIAAPILRELHSRLAFLDDVGLGYLTLDRLTRTLSGGESQRIALANSLGASLVDTLYVLDEPTIGLHARDNDRLIRLLERLRDNGNSVLVVEHDTAVINAADHIVELGPASGEKGGSVVFQGTRHDLEAADTATGRFLAGRDGAPVPSRGRATDGPDLRLEGAHLHNLEDLDISLPLNTLTVVTGVSGSGKSTLVHDVLYRALERELAGETTAKAHLGEAVGSYRRLDGVGHLDAVVLVDQSPIGRTPRSNPVTYIKAFDHIREIFSRTQLSKERGYRPGHFSFNVKGGRCEACKGDGVVQVEMVFMADVYVPCDVCGGARYRKEILEVRHKGKNIRDVLDLTVDEAIRFFIREDRLGQTLWQLQQVGLGYLRLGQPAPTLSGGEAQRLKIARELAGAGRKKGHKLYLLDEPTTGLSGLEVRKLLEVLQKLVDAGHTVLVIEHNLEVIRAADWVLDLGPEAGPDGGRLVGAGSPRDVAKLDEGHTGRYLAEVLGTAGAPPGL